MSTSQYIEECLDSPYNEVVNVNLTQSGHLKGWFRADIQVWVYDLDVTALFRMLVPSSLIGLSKERLALLCSRDNFVSAKERG